MNKEYLKKYKEKLSKLSPEEKKQRDIYLRGLASGEIQGPPTGVISIDKPWLKYYNVEQIKTDMPQKTCYQHLLDCNKDYMGRHALRYFGKKISFKELLENIDKAAKSLKSMGVKENDVITISLPNIPEAVYLFYACSKLGVVANMVDPRTSEEGIREYIEEVDSKLVIIVDSYFDKVKTLLDDKTVEKIVAVSPAESLPLGLKLGYKAKESIERLKAPNRKIRFNEFVINWREFIGLGKDYIGTLEADYVPNREFVIEHTGGTTGKPKGVLLTNENINAVALQSVLTGIDMKREHTWMDIMPTFIAYGVGMGLHLPLTIGMETILIPKFDEKKFDELILKHKPVHMIGVPSYWGPIINSKKMKKQDLSYMIAPTVGGDAMDTTLEKEANEFLGGHNCSSKIVKGYGMTEVCGGVAGTVEDNNEIGSVGIPFVKTTISIFDPETNEELGYNEQGEVCITGPNTMLRYFKNEQATKDILRVHEDGTVWVHSGDIGYITENGNLFIVDRIKNMIIRYDGFKVYPSKIETIISTHEAVSMCAVVGINDSEHRQGKLPKAHIVLKAEYKDCQDAVIEEIRQLCKSKLQEYALPITYKVREELPYTSVGKINRLALEEEDNSVKTMIKQ